MMILQNRVLTAMLEVTIVIGYLAIMYFGYVTGWTFGLY